MAQRAGIMNGTKGSLITAVDVGSTKIACFIVQSSPKDKLKVLGIGYQISKGMKNGNIIDMDAVEEVPLLEVPLLRLREMIPELIPKPLASVPVKTNPRW